MKQSSINLIKIFVFVICVLHFYYAPSQNQNYYNLEEKALNYFCENIDSIKPGLNDFNIKFRGTTIGKASNVYDIADCFGNISLIKDSIPIIFILDSLESINSSIDFPKTRVNIKCHFIKRILFAPFNNRFYTLHLFNSVLFDGYYYVEIYLVNKRSTTWIIVVKFDRNSREPISHCVKFRSY